jgi:hypothetical protein
MQRTFKLSSKSQAGGAQIIDLSGYERARIHQVQIDVSATPAAGTMDVSIQTPGASGYVSLGDIDLVSGPLAVMFDGYCDSIRLTPSSFDAAKTYNAAVFVLQV